MKIFPESKLAHKYLDGLVGLEIGGSIHNPFGLNTKNVDYTDSSDTVFKREEMDKRGTFLPVDIIAYGDNIPVPNDSYDFIVSSHVLEHFPDPIKALKEWYRIVKNGGYIFMIVPHKERMFDRNKPRTTVAELLHRHETKKYPESQSNHYSFWVTEDILDLIAEINLDWKVVDFQDVDDKVGNGFSIVIKKEKRDAEKDKKINAIIKYFKEKKERENRSWKKIMKIYRAKELWHNTVREYKKSGIKGIVRRMPYMYKWEKK